MNIVAAILTCSLYTDDAPVRAIVDNAHDNPLAIFTPDLDSAAGSQSSAPETLETAAAQLHEITAHGGRALVGLMQVPVAWASTFGREPTDLFDPCINVSIGSAMLSELDYVCARSQPSTSAQSRRAASAWRRVCAVQRYAELIGMPDLATIVALSLRYRRASLPTPNDAPIFHPPAAPRSWGSDCMFIATSSSDARWPADPRPSPPFRPVGVGAPSAQGMR